MKFSRHPLVLLLIVMGLSVWAGCGNSALEGVSDSNSYEARMENARMELDDENYLEAVELLLDLQEDYPNDTQIKAYLSNAYAGLAGLDTFNLLEVLADLDDAGSSGSIDMVGLTLGDESGRLSVEMLAEKLGYFNSAIAALDSIANPNDDQSVQRGLLGLFRVSLVLGQTIANDTGQSTVTLTEDGIKAEYEGQGEPDFDGDVDSDGLTVISDDIGAVDGAIGILDENADGENDLSEDFLEFKTDIDPNDDNLISVDELEGYVGDILND